MIKLKYLLFEDRLDYLAKSLKLSPEDVTYLKSLNMNPKYYQWIIMQYAKDKDQFKEDSGRYKEALEVFAKNKDRIKSDYLKHKQDPNYNTIRIRDDKSNEYLLDVDYRDILNIKSLHDLESITYHYETKKSKNVEIKELKEGAEKVFEDSNWLAIQVKTKEASCYYGANTKWCTAAETNNQFSIYNAIGPLIIIIDKKENKKYQLNLANDNNRKNSLMDELDDPIKLPIFKKLWYPINILYKKYKNKSLNDDPIIALLQFKNNKIEIKVDNKTKKLNVYGDFILDDEWIKYGKISILFNKIYGSFKCNSKKLLSLEDMPQYITSDFDCAETNIISLEGAPKKVGGYFDCSDTEITSLEGCPETVGGRFDCHKTNITSLEGCPKIVGSHFNCSHNDQLKSLKGIPNYIRGDLNCKACPIETLEYSPEKIFGGFDCSYTNIISLEHAPKYIKYEFNFFACKNLKNITELPLARNYYADNKFENTILKLVSKRGTPGINNDDNSIWLQKDLKKYNRKRYNYGYAR